MKHHLHTFKVNITPPLGSMLCGGLHGPAKFKETELHLRGLILSFDKKPIIFVAMDFCLLDNDAHSELTKVIANAAKTDIEKVNVHTVHQHDVPMIDKWAHKILDQYDIHFTDWDYWNSILVNTAETIKEEMANKGQEISYYSISKSKVFQFASNRRIKSKDGIKWRVTKCQDPKLKSYPVGKIDPFLKQCAFYDNNKKLLSTMNFYATHPQVANGRDTISDDAPGYALRKMDSAYPEAFHLYFNGCGGDLGNAKFASPDTAEDIEVFGSKLFHAMKRSQKDTKLQTIENLKWTSNIIQIPIKQVTKSKEELIAKIIDKDSMSVEKYISAMNLSRLEKDINEYPFKIGSLEFPDARLLFFPAEMFVEYQLYCQNMSKDKEVLTAAYGDGTLAYIPQDDDFEWGGYEVSDAWNWVKPGIEKFLKEKLKQILSQ